MLTSRQLEFCKHIADGKNASESYKIAFNCDSVNTCKSNGHKLLKKPEIQQEIDRLKGINQKIAERVTEKKIDKATEYDIASRAERMHILTQIARGDMQLLKPIVCDGMIEDVPVVPDWSDRKSAIAELNKMTGEYAASKSEVVINGNGLPSWMQNETEK